MAARDYPAPAGLSERSAALWAEVVPKRAKSAGRLALVEQALRARDRAEQASRIVEAEGITFTTKSTGAVHIRPEVKVERDASALFARIWYGMLCLHWSSAQDGR